MAEPDYTPDPLPMGRLTWMPSDRAAVTVLVAVRQQRHATGPGIPAAVSATNVISIRI
ncbi:hypothetical protein BAUCODRAFT_142730 [Baudoinia panamericana UAMH 10762]|uniref:Uncharacterized protein n=1 Tax=Baudoinia panamericana (strain UAMH 10762) TaxID=717646 RepID=M2ML97_BAUPA|nr:uncharacterized protein BAUCODRAFT_142730 [Baudoinia panamericana UAMH 10762]EMC92153.1 hypothetical protein BAUCODRAFT_142730 [Baudoinia panamericana UAMH 10762]